VKEEETLLRALYRIMAKWAYAECDKASPAELVAWVLAKLPPASVEAERFRPLFAREACEQLHFEAEAERWAASADPAEMIVRLDTAGYGWWKP
jgi:hypothetical protein